MGGGGGDTDDSGTDVPVEKVVGGLEEEEATSVVEAVGDVPEEETGAEVDCEGTVVVGEDEWVDGTDVVESLRVLDVDVGDEAGGGELGVEEGVEGGGDEDPGVELPGGEVVVGVPPGW